MAVESDPPGGKFGPSANTQARRPDCALSEQEIEEVRRLRKADPCPPIEDLAELFGVAHQDIEIALAAMRTPVLNPKRKTVNVGIAAYSAILKEKQVGEPIWVTMDRVLTELYKLRNASGRLGNQP